MPEWIMSLIWESHVWGIVEGILLQVSTETSQIRYGRQNKIAREISLDLLWTERQAQFAHKCMSTVANARKQRPILS